MMTIVSIVQDVNIRNAVEESISLLGGIESFIQPEDTVVIKPNLVFGLPPFTGFTTDPPVVEAIIRLCQKMNPSEVSIAEGSGGIDTRLAFRASGFTELAEKYGVNLVDLNESPTTKIAVPGGECVQELQVPRLILESDVIINVPKLKLYKRAPEHQDWASLAVKNLLGALPGKGEYSSTQPSGFCVDLSPEFLTTEGKYYHPTYLKWWSPRGEKRRIHANLAQGLVDVNLVIKPVLNVVDGVIVNNDVDMKRTKGMDPFELNTILASRDPLALDFVAARIGGLNPFDVSYLRLAAERGVGESDFAQIQLVGTQLEKVAKTWESGVRKASFS
ncbi:MAG: DUF362 domain-containing protein [Candidatus Thorarchaeota archaeon]|nr:MAG: DUF362 domain-containing protein [Candidatus Thorarchaeota archaeon]